jgi:predicted RNase H-like nuclease (RuvC/YqgF family)
VPKSPSIDSAVFRQKFLKRAEAEGVVFSHPKEPAELQVPQRPSFRSRWNLSFALPLAAACLLLGGLTGGYYWKVREAGRPARHDAKSTFASEPAISVRNEAADAAQEGALARLQEENRKLSSVVTSLKSSLSQQAKNANEFEENAAASEKERDVLGYELKQRQARIDDLERQIAQSQVELASAKTQLGAQGAKEDTVAADQVRIRELSDQLAEQTALLSRERDLLSADRDIRELMGARNLHIADVFDTDAKGKTRPTLGRIFFTEGKSLVFYAYDLNDHRVQNALAGSC